MIRIPGPDLSPIEAARRLGGKPGRFLLDSASDADGLGRWALVSAEPERVERARVRGGEEDLLGELARAEERALPLATQGTGPVPVAVGYLGYDLGRNVVGQGPLFRAASSAAVDDLGLDDAWFGFYGATWRHDRLTGRGEVVGVDERAAWKLRKALDEPSPATRMLEVGPLLSDHEPSRHVAAIERALEYIRAGDIYQVNLARRLRARILSHGDPLAVYERVTGDAPAPFGALLECEDMTIVSNSPELFLCRRAGSSVVETRPIKGTRARGREAGVDAVLAGELSRDEKERAEHLMIVDLERNDLGRVCRTGSVRVDDFARVVSLPTVHHLVSTVSGELRPGVGVADVLRATFPGGSITGAPKLRAMQVIDELEPVTRGVYTGAIGYVGAGGEVQLSIAIRTAILARGSLHLHVGGGIVADSRPERELEETEEKAAAFRRVLSG
ncbi:MAG: anthranilate synthase component I family protein [Deltaproteobacteria bacterium]|nr:anthranilate synthase component I family protein [Deltaproteobacteria bacterium]